MREMLILSATAVILLLAEFQASDYAAHFYGFPGQTQNFGLVVGDCYHFDAGIELLGTPGFFTNVC